VTGTFPHVTVSAQLHDCSGERIAHEVEKIGRAAERRCSVKAGFWAATFTADAIGAGELGRGGWAAAKAFLRARGLSKLFAVVGPYGRELPRAYRIARGAAGSTAAHYVEGASVTTVPLAVAENEVDDESTTLGDVLLAFVPFSSFERQKEEMVTTCNVEQE